MAVSSFVPMKLLRLLPVLLPIVSCTGGTPACAQTKVRVAEVSRSTNPQESGSYIFYDSFDKPIDTPRYFEVDGKNSFGWQAGSGIGGSGAMKCQFEKGQVSAGSLKIVFGKNPFRRGVHQNETFNEIYWRVYVKHEAGWQGNPAKLARATCMAAGDWSQGLIAHVWGGKGDVLCIDPASGITDNQKVSESTMTSHISAGWGKLTALQLSSAQPSPVVGSLSNHT